MKPYIITFLIGVFCAYKATAQDAQLKRNTISFDLGKTGLLLGLSYDYKLKNNNYGFRAGAGSNFDPYLKAIVAGDGGYHLKGKNGHYFETGVDVSYFEIEEISDDQRTGAVLVPDYPIQTFLVNLNLGYRRSSKNGMLRVGLSPGLTKRGFVPGAYFGAGLSF
jgi:hypothetical protein